MNKNLTFVILLILISISCENNQTSTKQSLKIDSDVSKTTTSDLIKQDNLTAHEFLNTTWINKIIDGVYDSLKFKSLSEAIYYSAELEYYHNSKFKIDNDTIKIDVYDFKSEVNPDAGLKIVSKYELVMIDSALTFTKIKHENNGVFQEVGKSIYRNVGKFKLAE